MPFSFSLQEATCLILGSIAKTKKDIFLFLFHVFKKVPVFFLSRARDLRLKQRRNYVGLFEGIRVLCGATLCVRREVVG